nr:glycosyltransferase family 2 protein [uncultured Mediterraneibacter sp.]
MNLKRHMNSKENNKRKNDSTISFIRRSLKYMKPEYVKKMADYIRKYGVKNIKQYIKRAVDKTGKPYEEWYEENRVTEEELQKQRETVFEKQPLISIVVPTYKTPIHFLREMMDSVVNQSYSNWELCIADGSEGDVKVEQELERYHQQDSRIKYKILEKNLGIAGNTNEALELAVGDYIGLFDHDDLLTPNALYEVVNALQETEYDILYTDEDKITGDGSKHLDPNFKPDFSMDLFRSNNYITHFFVVKKEIMDKVGGFRSEYDGAQDYDLMFRCIENATQIKHIPMILYHWRVHMNSVAGDPASKMYAYEAGKKAIEDHLKRMNIDATVEHTGLLGMYHVKYAIDGNPKISVIIPNKDHVEDLDKCIRSLYQVNTYKNFEIIIIENNSEKKETFQYYESLKKQHENVKVVTWGNEFNYSAINNFGVKYAEGDYFLFLNNDTEMITRDALEEMLGCCMREEVGAVGAKLLYADNTVQHAGVVIGFDNYAGHVNMGIGRDDYGYMGRARMNCNYSAVTAACMMTKKELFDQVGGFDEQFVIACNDVDYCLKLRELNKLIVFDAFSEWHHYESKSRGYEDTAEKKERFEKEKAKFQKKWQKVLDEGDPFYNKNFPITEAPFTLG